MDLSNVLRPVEMPGTNNLSLAPGSAFEGLYQQMVGQTFGLYQDGRSNYENMVGAPTASATDLMMTTEHDEANISYSIPIRSTTEFPHGRLYKEILAFVLNEGDNGSSNSDYVVVPIYGLNMKIRLNFFEGKKKLLSFIDSEIIDILMDNYALFPELNHFHNSGVNDWDSSTVNPTDMFRDEESDEYELDREQFTTAARNLAIELLYETMPEEMQLFQDKNKVTCWTELPSIVDCSPVDGRNRRNGIVDATERILKKTESPYYIPPVSENEELRKKLNEFTTSLNTNVLTGKLEYTEAELGNAEEEFGSAASTPFMKMIQKTRRTHDVKTKVKAKYREYIMSSLMLAKSSQIDGNQNYIPYLMAGGYWDNWYMLGIINTMFQGRDVHKYGVTKARAEIARIVTDRIAVVLNMWGPNLMRGDVLCLKVMRLPSGMINREQALRNPGQLGWNGYGSFFILPCISHVNKSMEESEDLMYYDIFGKLQKALLINVGVVKYDTHDPRYPTEERLKAIGLPNPATGHYPTIDESKRAMISLPKVSVLMRRRGY